MQSFLGCDAHKHYSVFVAVDERGKATPPVRIEHNVAAYQRYLDTLPNGTEIAIESTGNWYWIVDLMEQTGRIWPTRRRPRSAWARPTRPTLSTPRGSPSCFATARCPRAGFRLENSAINASCCEPGWLCAISAPRSSIASTQPSTATDCTPPASAISSASGAAPTSPRSFLTFRRRPHAWSPLNSIPSTSSTSS